ncbi:MAG: DUF1826 domain-containing protein [Myxococcales bacterium]|nr:DUF1826 domain-containing protein [Myxococcales bacterium]
MSDAVGQVGPGLAAARPREGVDVSPADSLGSSLRFVEHVADLTAIFEPKVNIVSLRREASAALTEETRRAVGEWHGKLFTVAVPEAEPIVAEQLIGLPTLAADALRWIEVLADLTGSLHVGVRLARLESAMCPRFHVDRVPIRLVTTYAGRGTEVLSNEHVDRARLGHGGLYTTDEASGVMITPNHVRSTSTFDVVLLKGDTWPDNAGLGAVHRSPPASAASPRLVMTLDVL